MKKAAMGVGASVDKTDASSRSGEKSNRFNSSPLQLPSVQLRYGRSFSNILPFDLFPSSDIRHSNQVPEVTKFLFSERLS